MSFHLLLFLLLHGTCKCTEKLNRKKSLIKDMSERTTHVLFFYVWLCFNYLERETQKEPDKIKQFSCTVQFTSPLLVWVVCGFSVPCLIKNRKPEPARPPTHTPLHTVQDSSFLLFLFLSFLFPIISFTIFSFWCLFQAGLEPESGSRFCGTCM